jgi:hypothetical protein
MEVEIMTNEDILRTFLEFSAGVVVVILFIYEKKLIALENKIISKIKEWCNAE